MSVELVTSVACNLSCPYCYQNPIRDAANFGDTPGTYDMPAMKAALLREGSNFTLFGGEALLMPIDDMEELFAFGLEHFGGNGIQSNGVLITPEHIELFTKYKVGVGLSADGPDEMNDSRWSGSLEKTRAATAKTMFNIEALVTAGLIPSVIVTLHRGNALPAQRTKFKDWFRWLDSLGLYSSRLHILEIDHDDVAAHMALTQEENIEILLDLADFESSLKQLRFELFKDVKSLLVGDDRNTVCVWNACDPKTTAAVRGVDGQGHGSNCGRTAKDGVMMLKTDEIGFERQVALYNTPQEDGGCQGCRFFIMCKGECPGTGIDGDWRNRTTDCATWMAMFDHHEGLLSKEGILPLSKQPERLTQIEKIMVDRWGRGQNIQIHTAMGILDGSIDPSLKYQSTQHGDAHGDSNVSPPWTHNDAGTRFGDSVEYVQNEHGDSDHGDLPHGDEHGDHSVPEHLDHDDLNMDPVIMHGDEAHGDSSGSLHGDEAHGDDHTDDTKYQDNHGDLNHGDGTVHEDSYQSKKAVQEGYERLGANRENPDIT